jgi:hypothetical protein
METHTHRDNVEKHFAILDDWMHGDEASAPDNAHKEQIRVYGIGRHAIGINPETGQRRYELHWRRAQEGNDKELLAKWRASEAAAKFRTATATPKRPEGVAVGRKLLVKWRCRPPQAIAAIRRETAASTRTISTVILIRIVTLGWCGRWMRSMRGSARMSSSAKRRDSWSRPGGASSPWTTNGARLRMTFTHG